MRIRRWGRSALVSLSVGLVTAVSLAPTTAMAELTPAPTATASASSTAGPSPTLEAGPTSTAAPAPSPVRADAAVADTAAADTAPPVLTGVSITPVAVEPGDALTITFTHTDDSPLAAASFWFSNRGLDFQVWTDTVAPVGGSHQVTLKTDAIDGPYVLTTVRLKDSAGNEAEFRADGTVVGRPNPPADGTHSVDFSKVSFTVSGSTLDVEPPVLTSLSLSSAGRYVGDSSTVAYAVTDQTLPLQSITLGYSSDLASSGATDSDASATGTLPVSFTDAGLHKLESVTIYDGRGLWSVYRRDGSVSDVFGGSSRHSLDFTKLDVTLLPTTPTVVTRSMPRGLGLAVWHTENELAGVSGYRVAVSPGGYSATIPATAGDRDTHEITGLTNGSLYTVSVTPLTPWGEGKTFTGTVTPLPSRNIFGSIDVNGDRSADVFAHLRDSVAGGDSGDPVHVYPGNGAEGFGRTFEFYNSLAASTSPGGDTNGDGRGDLLVVGHLGYLESIHRTGSVRLGTGWGSMRFIDGGADFSGDGRTDILAVTKTGDLYLYRVSYDRIVSSSKIGSGWGGMQSFFTPGDWSGDGRADIVGVDAAGDMWLYRGNGAGGFMSRLKIGLGWAGFGAVLPMRDFNGDGRADIAAVTMGGDLLLYPGNGRSGFYAPKKIGVGWHVFF